MPRQQKQDKAVERYMHKSKKRSNNPPAGLVSPHTDPTQPRKKYSHDPRLDPQLVWSGKRESSEFVVDTVSLHIHERIDPLTIIEKAMMHEDAAQTALSSFFDDPENHLPLRNAIEFYQHKQNWSNRLIAGDSSLVMNSLLEKEGMKGKVQMIYIDPPYGIAYGSNFQPFVNERDVRDGRDGDLTQEPETIKAFRDTWELEIHSYLTYLRDRLLLSRHLLNETGSCIVQISIKNACLVRMIMNEVFGSKNFVNMITVQKTTSSTSKTLDSVADYLVWYAKDVSKIKYRDLFTKKDLPINDSTYRFLELRDGIRKKMTSKELINPFLIPNDAKIMGYSRLTSQGKSQEDQTFTFRGEEFCPGSDRHWSPTFPDGMNQLASKNRLAKKGNTLNYVRYFDDFPYRAINNIWTDTTTFSKKIYVVQTNSKIIERIMLMTTDPGDLVLDPTCGSGTTAFAAEKLGRRWITCDTSRVALILAKQRLMTSIFDYYELSHPPEGVSSGFKYEEATHITLESVAKGEPPTTETLYAKPLVQKDKKRVSGPFTVEAVPAPTVRSIDALSKQSEHDTTEDTMSSHQQQWRDELLKTGIRGKSGQRIEFSSMNTHPATKWLHADAETIEANGTASKRAMISFGPKYAPLGKTQVEQAIQEARTLVPQPDMIIFAAMQFDPEASKDIDETKWPGVALLRAEMNKDLLTNDLKKSRSTDESFWLVGQPDIDLQRDKDGKYIITVNGFDYYNTETNDIESGTSSKIAMWMLDTDYDGRSLYPQQAFFPLGGGGGME